MTSRIIAAVKLSTLALLAATTLVACSSSGSSSTRPTSNAASGSSPAPTAGGVATTTRSASGDQQITLQATDQLRFMPMTIDARVGTVHITLVDTGSYPHDLSVPSLHKTSKTVSGDPGATKATMTVTFPHPGTYPFDCTYHATAGMRGRFVVRS